mmetsp:Transcript_15359/g.18511  ORF Transcript_15359/g.18511 Transcript_15359/m.18511 type:complete len:115 (+) Transcript_15359:111-455(+)
MKRPGPSPYKPKVDRSHLQRAHYPLATASRLFSRVSNGSNPVIKDVCTHWREGQKYFAQNLVDYDPPANNGGWQWAGSTLHQSQPSAASAGSGFSKIGFSIIFLQDLDWIYCTT